MVVRTTSQSSMKLQTKIILLIIFVLRYPIGRVDQEKGRLQKYFEMDVALCPICFEAHSNGCSNVSENFEMNFYQLPGIINSLFGVKHVHTGRIKNIEGNAVAKHSYNKEIYNEISEAVDFSVSNEKIEESLMKLFLRNDLRGFYFCPYSKLNQFIDKMSTYTSGRVETLMHILVDIETILFAALNSHKSIPTPKYYGGCGFTHYESYEGLTLSEWNYRKMSYLRKLEIAQQLLQTALALSEGFDDYRIYLTDLTLDNIVYNDVTRKIKLIDFDSVVIVDSLLNRTGVTSENSRTSRKRIAKHEKLDCDGCLAYSTEDLCENSRSDFNIFVVCQLLNEDLYEDETKGYLKPIPKIIDERFPHLKLKLQECVNCPGHMCLHRFQTAKELEIILAMVISAASE